MEKKPVTIYDFVKIIYCIYFFKLSGMSKSDKQQRATQLNATRKFVMEELKSGTITVSVDMLNSVTDASKDSTNCFYLLVTDSFKERLK